MKEASDNPEQFFEVKKEIASSAFEVNTSSVKENSSVVEENTTEASNTVIKLEDVIQTNPLISDLESNALNNEAIDSITESIPEMPAQEYISVEKTQLLPLEYTQLEVLH